LEWTGTACTEALRAKGPIDFGETKNFFWGGGGGDGRFYAGYYEDAELAQLFVARAFIKVPKAVRAFSGLPETRPVGNSENSQPFIGSDVAVIDR